MQVGGRPQRRPFTQTRTSSTVKGAINIKLDTRIFIRIGNEGVELNGVYSSRARSIRGGSNVRLPYVWSIAHPGVSVACSTLNRTHQYESRNLSRHLCLPSRTSNFNCVFLGAFSRTCLPPPSFVCLSSACLSVYLAMFAHFPAVLLP